MNNQTNECTNNNTNDYTNDGASNKANPRTNDLISNRTSSYTSNDSNCNTNHNTKHSANAGKLVLVGVPIGNVEDFSPRAVSCLKGAKLILCEDTRESGKLMLEYGISTKLISYVGSHGQALSSARQIINSGHDIALISDRGMPCVSDPGAEIIQQFRALNIAITCVPGPSAATTAFALTGYAGPFVFHGFLPRKSGEIIKIAQKLAQLNYHIIFFEAPNRIESTLEILSTIFVKQEITIARELTKTYEQIIQCKIEDAIKFKPNFKGECVIIIKAS